MGAADDEGGDLCLVVRIALKTLDRRSAPPSVITNGRPLALAGKFLPRRGVVRFMGATQRRAMSRD